MAMETADWFLAKTTFSSNDN